MKRVPGTESFIPGTRFALKTIELIASVGVSQTVDL